ncbi:MAG: fructosamine kinase family protein [Nitrosospira sp.]
MFPPWIDIAAQISLATEMPFIAEKVSSVGGGCINEAYRIEGNGQRFFVKLNIADRLDMFAAEAAGLLEIYGSGTLRVPVPVCWGKNRFKAWLVLEYLAMGGGSGGDAAALGSGLAAMHRLSSEKFGWERENTIGATPQINEFSSDWVSFWRKLRLGYQLKLAHVNGHTGKLQTQGEQLMAQLESFFPGPKPAASLLHGDLWSGNYGFDSAGRAILFDPAVYYGDRETDIAMTELFGGFSAVFYAAYRETYPLDPGYATRKTLYNLYHILNHLNLFGGGYLHQAEQMMSRLLAEIR